MRFRIALVAVTIPSMLSALAWVGCGGSSSCEEDLTCPRTGEGGSTEAEAETSTPDALADAPADVAEVDAPTDAGIDVVFDANVGDCAVTAAPKDDLCVVQDALGVFVVAGESDSNPGTLSEPVGTIERAAVIARGTGRSRIYVCGGTYTQSTTIPQGPAVSIYGGMRCAETDAGDGGPARDWAWTGANTKLAPSSTGVPLTLERLAGSATIADLELQARNATAPGASSIAAIVRSCADVRFDRVVMRAGDGENGSAGADGDFTIVPATEGNDNRSGTGGAAVACNCASGGTTTGGKGGNGALSGTAGDNGSPNLDGGVGKDGRGGAGGCQPGAAGADGRQGNGGTALGSAPFGSVRFAGWEPNTTSGTPAASGTLAQGGGGGGGASALLGPPGGGSGGCGGCGGQQGAAGSPGGSSFALLVYESPSVVLNDSQLFAGNGGKGGGGGDGQEGSLGALGGSGACIGGRGGRGGGGGGGAGGTGGLSVAIAYAGAAPTTSGSTTLLTAGAGAGGAGGSGGGAVNGGQQGKAGIASKTLSLP